MSTRAKVIVLAVSVLLVVAVLTTPGVVRTGATNHDFYGPEGTNRYTLWIFLGVFVSAALLWLGRRRVRRTTTGLR